MGPNTQISSVFQSLISVFFTSLGNFCSWRFGNKDELVMLRQQVMRFF